MAKQTGEKDVSNAEILEVVLFLKDKFGSFEENVEELKSTTDANFQELRARVDALEKGQEEILDTLRPLSKAHDKDTTMLLDHEQRLGRLEKQTALAK